MHAEHAVSCYAWNEMQNTQSPVPPPNCSVLSPPKPLVPFSFQCVHVLRCLTTDFQLTATGTPTTEVPVPWYIQHAALLYNAQTPALKVA